MDPTSTDEYDHAFIDFSPEVLEELNIAEGIGQSR
jgi:hypothetical protein